MNNHHSLPCQIIIRVDHVQIDAPQGLYYLEYKLSGSKVIQAGNTLANADGLLLFNQLKMLTFPLTYHHIENKHLDISLSVRDEPSSQRKGQMLGTLLLPIKHILQDKYKTAHEIPFQQSSYKCFIKLSCYATHHFGQTPQNRQAKSVQNSFSPPSQHSQSKQSSNQKSWESLLSSQHSKLAKMDSKQALQQRIKQMQKVDLSVLVKDNYRLQRLLYISKNQRKIENKRHDQELKDIARELSLKEAENITLKEELQGLREKLGLLLDQNDTIAKEKEELQICISNEKFTNSKLQQTYEALSCRVKQLCSSEQSSVAMREQLHSAVALRLQLQQQIEQWKIKENSVHYEKQQLQKKLNQQIQAYKHLQEQLKGKQEIANLCQQRLAQLQQKINCLQLQSDQDDEQQHCGQSSKEKYSKGGNIRIEDDTCSLNKILQEELQQSVSAEEYVKTSQQYYYKASTEIFTSTTLVQQSRNNNELQILQMLSQNLQRDYDQLKRLYRQQQSVITYKHLQLQDLEKSLAQMRYQFLVELSRVTAMMNHQILENRQLREQNNKLQTHIQQLKSRQTFISHQPNPSKGMEQTRYKTMHSYMRQRILIYEERDQYLKRCKQLQQDNLILIKYNKEREELYQMMMGRQEGEGSLIAEHFEQSLKYLIEHKQQYGSLLQSYGLHHQTRQTGKGRSKVSEKIDKLQVGANNEYFLSKQEYKFQSQLLIQSAAKHSNYYQQPSIKNVISEVVQVQIDQSVDELEKNSQILAQRDSLQQSIRKEIIEVKQTTSKQLMGQKRSSDLTCLANMHLNIEHLTLL